MLDTALESVVCNNCGADDPYVVFAAGVAQPSRVVRCRQCSLMYASPRIRDGVFREEDDPSFVYKDRLDALIEKARNQVRDYRDTFRLIEALYPNQGRLLEVGSSFGFHLKHFQSHGWNVEGLDPVKAACVYSERENGVAAKHAFLEQSNYPAESFDVVIMNHVIEHMLDPALAMREVYRIIKPGGHLVMETPTYDSLTFKVFGPRERSVACEGHMYFYTPPTLKRLYEQTGFKLVDQRYVGRTVTLNRLAWNLALMIRNRTVSTALDRATRSSLAQKMIFSVNLRDMVRVCVQRS